MRRATPKTPAAVLALIADLYTQLSNATATIEALKQQCQAQQTQLEQRDIRSVA